MAASIPACRYSTLLITSARWPSKSFATRYSSHCAWLLSPSCTVLNNWLYTALASEVSLVNRRSLRSDSGRLNFSTTALRGSPFFLEVNFLGGVIGSVELTPKLSARATAISATVVPSSAVSVMGCVSNTACALSSAGVC